VIKFAIAFPSKFISLCYWF